MDLPMVLALAVAILFFLVSGAVAVRNVQALREGNAQIRYTHDVIRSLDQLFSTVQDAETGQRGFLLTGDDTYLEPYERAVAEIPVYIGRIETLVHDHDVQRARLPALRTHVTAKLRELEETIALRRQGDGKAKAVIDSGRGKAEMDAIRARLDEMREEELRIRALRVAEMEAAVRNAVVSSLLSGAVGVALVLVMAALLRRTGLARARQAWLQRGQVELAAALQGDMAAPELGRAMLSFLIGYTGAQAGALFAEEGGRFRRLAMLGVPADAAIAQGFGSGEGMLGQVAANGRAMVVSDIPDGYLTIGSALGHDNPRHLLLAPLRVDDSINGVIELGFLQPVGDDLPDLFEQAASLLGTALRSAKYRSELQDLLEETQRQSEELQVQSEELRVSNEGLEEQSRALRESQVRLEGQQVELEQINTQLEDQARELARQRDHLARSNAEVELKARELERSSQYKSDFLANMSHELRTPLNSLLILSKLLGDNAGGNLTGEQVGFARTIESSGSDLLLLINDILDLSKIEAGHLRIQPQIVPLQRLVADLRQQFEHVAAEKGLGLAIELDGGAPATIESDSQRLQQILKNLLSNALKFTEAGEVSLRILPAGADGIAFAVRDTGIGISPEQQAHIFEAFHQADGAISRRYGGTGLGLSISRELARLLGGGITLDSTAGEGSLFTVTLPLRYDPSRVTPADAHPRPAPEPAPPATTSEKPAAAPRAPVDDDRHRLSGNRRILLVVEDDPAFARIMCDLSREMGFECVVAGTAEEALAVAREFRPSAVVLDIGLPDQSGLTVLDRLKQDDATRHIPVHVISGGDHAHAALSLGAMGYLLKPVRREQVAEVLQGLERKLAQTMRRVLIVEDDPVQREAVQRLLEAGGTQTVGAGSAAECLERLEAETFDCMVLDLSLPDASGFSLLERLGESDRVQPFPPVIVYTGHDLSPQEEQRLRRYSSSIIIKGAKSPERLLDEVSLFLHQVVSDLPQEQQRMIRAARHRDAMLEGRRILIVEDDVRNVYSLSNVLEPRGARIEIARNGREAITALAASAEDPENPIDLVLMDVMMPVMDGLSATKEIRRDPRWRNLPIIALTANAMPDDQERCLKAGASDYMSKPLDVEKLLSLVRVWLAG